MNYPIFDIAEVDDGVFTLEAMASTAFEQQADVMAEVQQVLSWARKLFPDSRGPVDDGMDWDDDLQFTVEDGIWHTVTLTLTGSPRFVEAFAAAFGSAEGAERRIAGNR